jgi:hypothetical protein
MCLFAESCYVHTITLRSILLLLLIVMLLKAITADEKHIIVPASQYHTCVASYGLASKGSVSLLHSGQAALIKSATLPLHAGFCDKLSAALRLTHASCWLFSFQCPLLISSVALHSPLLCVCEIAEN